MDFDTLLQFSKQFALVWFFLIFLGVVVWAYWPGHKQRFEEEGNRMLEDDPIHDLSAKRQIQDRPVVSSQKSVGES